MLQPDIHTGLPGGIRLPPVCAPPSDRMQECHAGGRGRLRMVLGTEWRFGGACEFPRAGRPVSDPEVIITQIVLALAVLILWLGLLNSWRLRNWRAVTLGAVGTIAILAAGMLPNPARAVAQAGIWLVVGWVFQFRPELVGVMSPEEYDYVDAHIQILRRIDRRKHASDRPDPITDLREFEANVRSLEALNAPLAWSKVHRTPFGSPIIDHHEGNHREVP